MGFLEQIGSSGLDGKNWDNLHKLGGLECACVPYKLCGFLHVLYCIHIMCIGDNQL